MQEHTVTLQDDEFRLFQNKWLQIGDKTCFRPIQPVKPKKGSPLASQIIIEQRNGLDVWNPMNEPIPKITDSNKEISEDEYQE